MTTKKAYTLYNHVLPGIVNRFPFLIWFANLANRFLHNRNRIALSLLKKLLSKNRECAVLDAGCGEGNYLIPLSHSFKNAQLTGLDNNEGLVNFLNTYAKSYKRKLHAKIADLNQLELTEKYDVIICIAVLQMLQDEDAVLQTFKGALKNEGKILINVPIVHEPVFGFKPRFKINYDAVQASARKRYTLEQIQTVLQKNGFKVEQTVTTNGVYGTAGNELLNLGLDLLQNINLVLKVLFFPIFALIFIPLILLLNLLNAILPKKKMSGVVVIASVDDSF